LALPKIGHLHPGQIGSPSMAIVTITYPMSKSKRVVTQLVRLA
jgi:hypothetical protein